MMNLKETLLQIGENMRWEAPKSVGTARVNSVQKPHRDMVFLALGDSAKDLTANEFVFTPTDWVREGDIVEVLIREARFQPVEDRQLGLPRKCSVAIRPFKPETRGKISPEDKKALSIMFTDSQNIKDPLSSRAFYRRFMEGNLRPISTGDIIGPGQNL